MVKDLRRERDYRDRDRDRSHRRQSPSPSRSSRDRDGSRSSKDNSPSTMKRLRTEGDSRSKDSGGSSSNTIKVVSRSSTSNLPPPPVPTKSTETSAASVGKKEIYDGVCEWEMQNAKSANVEEEMENFMFICDDLQMIMDEIQALKASGKDISAYEDKKVDALMMLTDLRRLNRLFKLRLKASKDEVSSARQEVDKQHLQLQNLLYEATHLNNQVAAVQDYKGMDEKIDLIPVEQFYAEAPERISKPEITRDDPHMLRLARLEYEYVQREELTEKCNELQKEKEEVMKSTEQTQAKLDNVRPLLTSVLNATQPLQDYFGLNISLRKQQFKMAESLPPPLYVLYTQSVAFQEAMEDAKFTVAVGGDIECAREFCEAPDEPMEDDSDSDKEADDYGDDMDTSSKRKLKKRGSIVESLEERRKRLFQKHPLWVQWQVQSKNGDAVLIHFSYFVKLKIITAKTKVITTPLNRLTEPLESSDNVLTELFPHDFGIESPNPANMVLLRKLGLNGLTGQLSEIGRPYKWCQDLGGLEYLPLQLNDDEEDDEPSVTVTCIRPKIELSSMSIERVLKAVKKRLGNQTILLSQLKSLESRNIQVPTEAKDLFPSKNSSSFSSWTSISWEDYRNYKFTHDLIQNGCVSEKANFYKVAVERGRVHVIALVTLSVDFPVVPPIFCIQIEQDGEERDSCTDPAIKEIGKELNIYAPKEFEAWPEYLVSLQIMRLLYCVDILLETDLVLGQSAGPSEFGREKLFMNPAKGRNQRRPYKYVGKGGGYFVQRY